MCGLLLLGLVVLGPPVVRQISVVRMCAVTVYLGRTEIMGLPL